MVVSFCITLDMESKTIQGNGIDKPKKNGLQS